MDHGPLKLSGGGAVLAGCLAVGLAGLVLLTQTVQNSAVFGRWHNPILIANSVGALLLLGVLLINLYGLLRDRRRQAPGAALKLRMLGLFAVIATGPVVVVFLVAVQFLHRGIETWADDRIASSLQQSLELSRAALDAELRVHQQRTLEAASQLNGLPTTRLYAPLARLRAETGSREMTVFGRNYRIIATSAEGAAGRMPELLTEDVLLQLPRDGRYVSLEPLGDSRLQVRVAVTLGPAADAPGDTLILQALYPVGAQLGALAESVQGTYTRYDELVFLREPIEASFTVALFVSLLLALFTALYAALLFARRFVAPIRTLVAGTQAVAAGHLDTRLPVTGRDDFSMLLASFNDMTARLEAAGGQAAAHVAETERARASLATLLARLTSGVIAIDSIDRLRIANETAGLILQAPLADAVGQTLAQIAANRPVLAKFFESCAQHNRASPPGWREQLILRDEAGGRRVLMCSASPLADEQGGAFGCVLVFDDITAMLQAQREAAWGEVARRLAHEIKNPLTPIQLSAERIRKRYLASLPAGEGELLDRATHTIVQQVEAMRDMVNAFSDYARAPDVSFAPLPLNALVREVSELYQGPQQPEFELALDASLGAIEADAVRLRQLLHNLIRNACEALEGTAGPRIEVRTRALDGAAEPRVEIQVRDNGPGIDPALLERIFDPYVTSKSRGTGLGLAIVRRLVEEHGGSVSAENAAGGGASIRVTLPITQRSRDGLADARMRWAGERR